MAACNIEEEREGESAKNLIPPSADEEEEEERRASEITFLLLFLPARPAA
jgi:hypothetical protein